MQLTSIRNLIAAFLLLAIFTPVMAQNEHYQALQQYFERVASESYEELFTDMETVEQWESERAGLKSRLLDMLGLDERRPDNPPVVKVTNRIETRDYVVECLVVETAPGIYITGNFYIPRGQGNGPFPLIIYQSGHAPKGPYGAKSVYKHHGAWFGAHGFCCFLMDTIQMSELKVTHHGVYFHHWYDWYSRGYSPLAAELFNASRALDYLVQRPEVDQEKIGATGRSGGGVTSFFLHITDDRISASAPVSGVCSTVGQVEGRLAGEHCDCMYPVNNYGLLFSEMGALAAPRPMLLCNATADQMYPMQYFEQLVNKMGAVYNLYGVRDNLQYATAPGGHRDIEEIRIPVFNFFRKQFQGKSEMLTEQGPVDTLSAADLLCFRDGIPLDERLSQVHRNFMPRAHPAPLPVGENSLREYRRNLAGRLRSKVFTFLGKADEVEWKWDSGENNLRGRSMRSLKLSSFVELNGDYTLPQNFDRKDDRKVPAVLVIRDEISPSVWDQTSWEDYRWGDRAVLILETTDVGTQAIDASLRHHMLRESMLLGRMIDVMRVGDVKQGLAFLRAQPEVDPDRITILGRGAMGVNGLYAALLDGGVERVVIENPTASHETGPIYPGILRYTDIPQVMSVMADKIRLVGDVPVEVVSAIEQTEPRYAKLYSDIGAALKE